MQVDPTVSAAVWLASSAYFSHVKDFAEFYKSSLMYLAFVSSKDLEPDYRMVSPFAHAQGETVCIPHYTACPCWSSPALINFFPLLRLASLPPRGRRSASCSDHCTCASSCVR